MRTLFRGLALLAGCVALILPGASRAQEEEDLDLLSDEEIAEALYAELDDVYERLQPEGVYNIDVLYQTIMYALSDAGDDDSEDVIDMEELDEEMGEAGDSLAHVVSGALQSADQVSDSGQGGLIRVQRARAARTRVAVAYVSQAIVPVIRAANR
ncbi:hypothetical protein [Phenylobacterium sp.]|uniref:hypothetical protein n=1 Tax=Phenylobacterium sp. TaxID=1871053 RepID=UPI00121F51B2|nr:hypothetical protein [Phenylobacterium sp.]TAL34620.1 MAG: hypothetical protein EPN98_08150 [Phenylobacterium sp.]